ncbi:hypothetical protein YC2023_074020 [Brassica napus]
MHLIFLVFLEQIHKLFELFGRGKQPEEIVCKIWIQGGTYVVASAVDNLEHIHTERPSLAVLTKADIPLLQMITFDHGA